MGLYLKTIPEIPASNGTINNHPSPKTRVNTALMTITHWFVLTSGLGIERTLSDKQNPPFSLELLVIIF
jgi:hypothetical protein